MSTAPDFRWAAIYYPGLLQALLQLKAQSWPEHTEEDPADPVVQLYRMMAVVGHLNASRLDHVARELYLPTLQLRSSAIALGRLVGYQLATAVPAEAQLLATLSGSLATPTDLVKAHSTFSTTGDGDTPAVLFEHDSDNAISAGPTGVYNLLEDDGGIVAPIDSLLPLSLFAGTAAQNTAAQNDALYIGGTDLMFTRVALTISVAAAQPDWWVWEYRDDLRDGQPDSVVDNGSDLTFAVEAVIGSVEASGLEVTVTCLRTGQSETVAVDGSGGTNEITTSGLLGQTTPSTSVADYLIEAEWFQLEDLEDGTGGLAEDGTVSFTLPQTTARRWAKSDPQGTGTAGYWIRVRMFRNGTQSAPTLDAVAEPKKTTWSILWDVRQGQRVTDRIGTTDSGTADQGFTLSRSPYMEMVTITVDDDPWTIVDNFLSSAAYDKHVRLREEPDESWSVTFGDGTNGKIPPSSAPVVAIYRIGGGDSGNVGAETITRDRSGNSKLRGITNPRPAAGWVAQEGTTADSLDDLREIIPDDVRTSDRVVTPTDAEVAAVAFNTADGSQPVIRALAVEEGNGPKTIQLICVGVGGAAPVQADLDELDDYFNGEQVGIQRVGGVIMANHELTAEAYTPRAIDVTVTVRVLSAYYTGAQASIEAALSSILTPIATRQILNADGVWEDSGVYLWVWGGDVDPGVLQGAIFTAVNGVVGSTMTVPAAPITLATGELPVVGTLAVTVQEVVL